MDKRTWKQKKQDQDREQHYAGLSRRRSAELLIQVAVVTGATPLEIEFRILEKKPCKSESELQAIIQTTDVLVSVARDLLRETSKYPIRQVCADMARKFGVNPRDIFVDPETGEITLWDETRRLQWPN